MTCAFTRRFGTRLSPATSTPGSSSAAARPWPASARSTGCAPIEVADGRTPRLADDAADVAFSYITLQHCERDDALALVDEALRVVRPGGQIALNFRSWSGVDPFVLPIGVGVRGLFRVPVRRSVADPPAARRPASPGRPTGSTRTR